MDLEEIRLEYQKVIAKEPNQEERAALEKEYKRVILELLEYYAE